MATGFFDPDDGEGGTVGRMPPIALERHLDADGHETFAMRRRLGYLDRHHDEPFVVPADLDSFRSDLTSVPTLFTWLVPRTGQHLPAALIHDGLVLGRDEPVSHIGPEVDRVEADRIFRDAMGDLGTGLVRRWLVWTAVVIASLLLAARQAWRWRLVITGSGIIVLGLGAVATLDALDVIEVLPWMGDRVWWREILGGAVGAVAIPTVISLIGWRGFRIAGVIAGVALALLIHVTLALGILYGGYLLLEHLLAPLDSNRRRARETVSRDVDA